MKRATSLSPARATRVASAPPVARARPARAAGAADRLTVHDLEATCHIGVTAAERRRPQGLRFTLTLYADLRTAGRRDRLADTVDYSVVARRVRRMAGSVRFKLIEALAERAAALCLAVPRVARVTVRLEKPGAVRGARSAEVEITREKPS